MRRKFSNDDILEFINLDHYQNQSGGILLTYFPKDLIIKAIKNDNFRGFSELIDTEFISKMKNDYLVGFITGLNDAMKQQFETEKEVALALVTPQDVKDELDIIVGDSKPEVLKSSANRLNNRHVVNRGYSDGHELGSNRDRRLEE
jgi:hypothetical protein